jgi:hypothetical protein
MFTTVRKSLGFIAPVIPNGKHLQQTNSGLLEALLPAARNAYGGVSSTKDKQSSSLPDNVPQQFPNIWHHPRYGCQELVFLHTRKID